MFSSWKIAKPFGIDLLIHWSFWLLPVWVVFTERADFSLLSMNLLLIAAMFVCVVLHELGHALAARHFGIGTRRILLTPLGGIAQLDRMSHKPWEEFCIAVAGPAVNVAIALVLGVILAAGYVTIAGATGSEVWYFLSVLLELNVIMVLFNMLPAFPMDGGRVLRAVLASAFGLLPGTRIAVAVGTVVAAIIGIGGVLLTHNPFLLMIGLFVIYAGQQELKSLEAEVHERETAAEEEWNAPSAQHVVVSVWDPERHIWKRMSHG